MIKIATFTGPLHAPKDCHFYSSYNILLAPDETWLLHINQHDYLVIGIGSRSLMTRMDYAAFLDNAPHTLLIRKVLKKGGLSERIGVVAIRDVYDNYNDFLDVFKGLSVYVIYEAHQLDLAIDNVNEFCDGREYSIGRMPGVVLSYMNHNKWFCQLVVDKQLKRDQAIAQAKVDRMKMQEGWWKDVEPRGIDMTKEGEDGVMMCVINMYNERTKQEKYKEVILASGDSGDVHKRSLYEQKLRQSKEKLVEMAKTANRAHLASMGLG